MKQNILIIGRNGFLATNLFKYFKSKKISVVKNSFNFFLKNQEKKLLKYNYVINCSINNSFLNKKYDPKYDQDLLCAEKLKNIKSRQSIYYSKDIIKGDLITGSNIKIVRPSLGLHPKYFDKIIGKKLKKNVTYASREKLKDF